MRSGDEGLDLLLKPIASGAVAGQQARRARIRSLSSGTEVTITCGFPIYSSRRKHSLHGVHNACYGGGVVIEQLKVFALRSTPKARVIRFYFAPNCRRRTAGNPQWNYRTPEFLSHFKFFDNSIRLPKGNFASEPVALMPAINMQAPACWIMPARYLLLKEASLTPEGAP
jgi:hypothetical protein